MLERYELRSSLYTINLQYYHAKLCFTSSKFSLFLDVSFLFLNCKSFTVFPPGFFLHNTYIYVCLLTDINDSVSYS